MDGGILVAFGSNEGDRRSNLESGLSLLASTRDCALTGVSALYETDPVGLPGAPDFYNMAAELRTELTPKALLARCHDIERKLGRRRDRVGNTRSLDIDILLYHSLILDDPQLAIPHPRMHLRRFVLVPANDVAAAWIHPVLGRSVQCLLEECKDRHSVRRIASRVEGGLKVQVSSNATIKAGNSSHAR